jgi:hypothetical protein
MTIHQPDQSLYGFLIILLGIPVYYYFKRQPADSPADAGSQIL